MHFWNTIDERKKERKKERKDQYFMKIRSAVLEILQEGRRT
jgi:hypothetical protein